MNELQQLIYNKTSIKLSEISDSESCQPIMIQLNKSKTWLELSVSWQWIIDSVFNIGPNILWLNSLHWWTVPRMHRMDTLELIYNQQLFSASDFFYTLFIFTYSLHLNSNPSSVFNIIKILSWFYILESIHNSAPFPALLTKHPFEGK